MSRDVDCHCDTLTCPRRMGRDILDAAGLPDDLWAAEALVDDADITVFHVGRLSEILAMNDLQLGRGWSAGFAVFALCRTREQAHAACERMRAKQRALKLLGGSVDEGCCTCDACEGVTA